VLLRGTKTGKPITGADLHNHSPLLSMVNSFRQTEDVLPAMHVSAFAATVPSG